MRMKIWMVSAALVLGLAACRQDEGMNADDAALLESQAAEADAPAGAAPAAPAAAPTPGYKEQKAAKATLLQDGVVQVGSALGADGKVTQARAAYAAGETVHVSVSVAGRAAGKPVTIYWFAADGVSVKTETKPVQAGQAFVDFALGKADGMKPGTYSAQVDFDDVPLGMADFRVQ